MDNVIINTVMNTKDSESSVLSEKWCENDSELMFCRICHQTEGIFNNTKCASDELISPCNCSGSMANVHRQCLQRWASIASSGNCDICGYDYNSRKQLPSILTWFKNLLMDRRYRVECIVLFMIGLITPLIIFATLLSSFVVKDYYIWQSMIIFLLTITIISWILYTIIIVWSFRFLYLSFMRWRTSNTQIELVWDDISPISAQNSSQLDAHNYI